jgi:hypothetical protein
MLLLIVVEQALELVELQYLVPPLSGSFSEGKFWLVEQVELVELLFPIFTIFIQVEFLVVCSPVVSLLIITSSLYA